MIKKYCYRLQKEVFRNIKYDNLLLDFSTATAVATSNRAAEKIRQDLRERTPGAHEQMLSPEVISQHTIY